MNDAPLYSPGAIFVGRDEILTRLTEQMGQAVTKLRLYPRDRENEFSWCALDYDGQDVTGALRLRLVPLGDRIEVVLDVSQDS